MSTKNKFNIIIPPQNIDYEPSCLKRFVNGDRDAFAWIYKNYSRKVLDYVILMTGNKIQSEDIVQDIFLKLWINRDKLATVENFNGYLYRMQKNMVINFMNQQQTEKVSKEKYIFDSLIPITRVDEKLEQKELEENLQNEIILLPPKQQTVYRLSKEKGWKREKIANALNISPFTVKCHMQKALKFLRLRMKVWI